MTRPLLESPKGKAGRRYREKCKAEGICMQISCTNKAVPGNVNCEACKERHLTYITKRYYKRKEKGVCVICAGEFNERERKAERTSCLTCRPVKLGTKAELRAEAARKEKERADKKAAKERHRLDCFELASIYQHYLTPRQFLVFSTRYGGARVRTLREIAEEWGVSHAYIGQVERDGWVIIRYQETLTKAVAA